MGGRPPPDGHRADVRAQVAQDRLQFQPDLTHAGQTLPAVFFQHAVDQVGQGVGHQQPVAAVDHGLAVQARTAQVLLVSGRVGISLGVTRDEHLDVRADGAGLPGARLLDGFEQDFADLCHLGPLS